MAVPGECESTCGRILSELGPIDILVKQMSAIARSIIGAVSNVSASIETLTSPIADIVDENVDRT